MSVGCFGRLVKSGFLSNPRIMCPNPNTQTVYAIDKCDTQQQTDFQNLINAHLLAFILYKHILYAYICYNVGIVSLWMEILLFFLTFIFWFLFLSLNIPMRYVNGSRILVVSPARWLFDFGLLARHWGILYGVRICAARTCNHRH